MEQNQPKTVVVNGHDYTISKFLADDGLRVFVRVAKIVAEPLAKAVELNGKDTAEAGFGDVLGDIIGALVERMDETVVIKTFEDLLSLVIPEGQTYPLANPKNPSQGNWKTFFQGKQGEMLQVVFEAAKENYEDFFGALKLVAGSKLNAALAKKKAK